MNDAPHTTTAQPLTGRTLLITGATGGLGRGLALESARRGATLLLHGRNPDRLDEVLAEVRALGATARGYLADLSDLAQVRTLAERVRTAEPRLDVLVNNAIARVEGPTVRGVGAQGHELQLTVNHLAPYALTRLLLPLLTRHPGARVVNVASMGQAPIDFADPMLEQGYDGVVAYCRSKLALIMATFDLAAELPAEQLTVNAVHPAHLMDTPGLRAFGLAPQLGVEEGVRPTIRLIADPELALVTGRYFDRFTEAPAHEQAYDPAARAQLAELTARLTAPFTAPLG
ncbi:SDR family NAD(P)-dependent oxidoreductase [Kitasatospora sp. LaBMicrA B282]|uniref:SDR family NAD(P)-dependent oxidoreductase n=1 Tax=Kitasatospora sp. LaBMicrA B282 TaxID=3420949 RepID=UPI003D0D185C